jgi:hypothetical protein
MDVAFQRIECPLLKNIETQIEHTERRMKRSKIFNDLERARATVALCKVTLSLQRNAVAELEREGQDSSLERKSLRLSEYTETMHLAEKYRLEKKLEEDQSHTN